MVLLSAFLASHFPIPPSPREVSWFYHAPRPPPRFPAPVRRLVLSITPTPGFYNALSAGRQGYVAAFLHRPWALDRRNVPRRTTVWACHKGFDEELTVGVNWVLAGRLGVRSEKVVVMREDGSVDGAEGKGMRDAVVLQGYKGDPERKIGLVGALHGDCVGWQEVQVRVEREFGGKDALEGVFGFEDAFVNDTNNNEGNDTEDKSDGGAPLLSATCTSPQASPDIRAIAIMNAFQPAEVARVAAAAFHLGLISSLEDCSDVLYLTGAVREEGLIAARERGMKVICVGHRVCESWGIEFLAQRVREEFGRVEVVVIDEKDEEPPKEEKGKKGKTTESG